MKISNFLIFLQNLFIGKKLCISFSEIPKCNLFLNIQAATIFIQNQFVIISINNMFENRTQILQTPKWHQLLGQNNLIDNPINQFILISQQNSLMESIKDQIMNKLSSSQPQTSVSGTKSQASFISTQIFLDDNSINFSTSKSKFAQQMEDTILETALLQVKNNCSQDTYEIIFQATQTKKGHETLGLQRKYDKAKKQIEDLSNTVLNLRKQKANLQWELNMLKPKCQNLEVQRSKLKQKQMQITNKQALLTKTQQALLLRDKYMLQSRKRHQRQEQTLKSMKLMLENHVKQYIQIWNKICNKCDSIQCPQNCWRKDTLNKCKERILQWRKSLAQQQAALQKQQHIVLTVSQQFKKLISDQRGSN